MRIGTTPTHTFTLPSDIAGAAQKVRVIYSQADRVILTKDVTALSGDDVTVTLTQEDTLKFHDRKPIEIQLRVLTGDAALTSDIVKVSPYECLEREVFA